jgi:hypothetical protein
MTRKQRKLWEAEWTHPFSTWCESYAKRNEWRVLPDFGWEDLLQEYAFKFAYLQQRYPTVTEPAHFMSLLQVSCVNLTNNFASKRRRRVSTTSLEVLAQDADAAWEPELADTTTIVDAVDVVLHSDPSVLRFIAARVNGEARVQLDSRGIRETASRMAARVTGCPNAGKHLRDFRDALS